MTVDTHVLSPADPAHGALVATIEGLEAQLNSIYEERSSTSYLAAESALENLAAQLSDLYAEREMQAAAGTQA
jgi:hypothetical protein